MLQYGLYLKHNLFYMKIIDFFKKYAIIKLFNAQYFTIQDVFFAIQDKRASFSTKYANISYEIV